MVAARSGDSQSAGLPNPALRTFLNLILFVHLFAISVAATSYVMPSELQGALKRVLAPYLGTFNFDLTHNYPSVPVLHLTHAQESDVDYVVEFQVGPKDGEPELVRIPDVEARGERRVREQVLANTMGSLAQNGSEQLEGELPRAIGTSLLEQRDIQNGTSQVRCFAHVMQPPENLRASEPSLRDPFSDGYYTTALEGQVAARQPKPRAGQQAGKGRPGKVEYLWMKKSAASETAPLDSN